MDKVAVVLSARVNEFVSFPTTELEITKAQKQFYNIGGPGTGMPGIVGAIDGTHVKIPGPSVNERAAFQLCSQAVLCAH